MGDATLPDRIAVLSSSWGAARDELAFAVRSVAGAASRVASVEIFSPRRAGPSDPDGAFDVTGVGTAEGGSRWPAPAHAAPLQVGACLLVVLDQEDPDGVALADHLFPGAPVVVLGPADPSIDANGWGGARRDNRSGGTTDPGQTRPADGAVVHATWSVGIGGPAVEAAAAGRPPTLRIGLHVPVNPLAAAHRHNGLGFTDYTLVLSDRGPGAAGEEPTALAAWLAARFPRQHVVVVEQAVASVWRSRSLRGRITVDTRADLWRLVAHARVVVDLGPGPLVARECIESLRFGVPVVVPAGTPGAALAARGGGLCYRDVAELLGCVEVMDDRRHRDELGAQGQRVADEWYGDTASFVARVHEALRTSAGPPAVQPATR